MERTGGIVRGGGLLAALLALAGCGDGNSAVAEWLHGEGARPDTPAPAAPVPEHDTASPAAARTPPEPGSAAPVRAVDTGPADVTDVAAPTRPFAFDTSPAAVAAASPCMFSSLANVGTYRLYAAGAYSGRKLGFHIDRSGHEGTTVDVLVNSPATPVALMLGNYEPTVWNIGWTEGTRIVAVLVGGYHTQQVTGLPAQVPLRVSTHDNRGGCEYFYVSADKPAGLNPLARRVFGQGVDMLYPVQDGRVVIGPGTAYGAASVTDAAAKPVAAFRVAESRAGGEQGLAYAVSQGWLRPATSADSAAWQAALQARPQGDVPPVAGGQPRRPMTVHNGYVVLRSFELPAGLYGAHSATFFVPRGVQPPTGNPGHSAIYDFNTLTCRGAVCGMGD